MLKDNIKIYFEMLDENFNAILHNFAFIWFSDLCFSFLNTRKQKMCGKIE